MKNRRKCLNCAPSRHDRCKNLTLPGARITSRASNTSSCAGTVYSIPSQSTLPSSPQVSSVSSLTSPCPPSLPSSCPPSLPSSSKMHSSIRLPAAAAAPGPANPGARHVPNAATVASGVTGVAMQPPPVSNICGLLAGDSPPERRATRRNSAAPSLAESNGSDFTTSTGSPSFPPAPISGCNSCPELPPFHAAAEPNFTWGELNGDEFKQSIRRAYDEVAHWRRNVFMLPSGKAGKQFVREITSLFTAYAQGSSLECVAIEAVMVASTLLLQKPHQTSKCREHVQALDRRLRAWQAGDIDGLMREGRTIQLQLRPFNHDGHDQTQHNIRIFSRLVFEGKIHAAIRFLSDNHGGGVLNLSAVMDDDRTVLDVLMEKHPPARSVAPEVLVTTDAPHDTHPVYFECLTGSQIRSAALCTQGAAGPSGVDAAGWRRMCTSFHRESVDLCASIAAVARRLCTTLVDPEPLRALVACRLIPLDKQPGVRPIGICEVLRRIIGKAVMKVVKTDVLQATGPDQLCGGHESGCEAAVHAMREIFRDSATDGILFVDASNAFNNLNRQAALWNIQYYCPAVAKILINCYRSHACLFVGGKTLLSQEGTTQGDPLAMMMFAIATVPLIKAVKTIGTTQAWFADDAASGGQLRRLRQWWDALLTKGPAFGYYPNAAKTVLLVKPELKNEATVVFGDTEVQITEEGKIYLGGAFGTDEFQSSSLTEKVLKWAREVDRLAEIANAQPHAAFAAFTHGLIGRWIYGIRVSTVCADEALKPLEEAISQRLIPALTGQSPPAANMRSLLALPARLGGLGLVNPQEMRQDQQESSRIQCQPLTALILEQEGDAVQTQHIQQLAKKRRRQELRNKQGKLAETVIASMSQGQQKCAKAAQEKGASAWLAAVPVKQLGFALHKSAFRDAICLRYGWQLRFTPEKCRCGTNFEVNHVLACRQGGFQTIRHNDLRDTISTLLSEVSQEVTSEPRLQPLSGETLRPLSANMSDEARLDIRARGFWDGLQDAFFDVRIFHPFASSYQNSTLSALYRQHEQKKRREYGDRVREVEHGCFTPLIFTTSGGAAPEATIFLRRLASMLCDKRGETYSATMGWLRCAISFCLLRSSLRCLRASQKTEKKLPISLDIAEAAAGGCLPK